MNIAIYDAACNLRELYALLEKYAPQYIASTVQYDDGKRLLEELVKGAVRCDILFLDMEKSADSILLAKALQELPCPPSIVAVAHQSEQAIQNIGGVFLCLTMPVKPTLLLGLLQAAEKVYDSGRLVARCRGKLHVLQAADIDYVESFDHAVTVHYQKQVCEFRLTMAEVLEQLRDYGFAVSHRSYIVNIWHITKIHDDALILRTGEAVPLSRRRRNYFEKLLRERSEALLAE